MLKINILIFEGFWTVKDAFYNPEYLFLFGDNDLKKGLGGQAIIREYSNTIGIPTKKYPGRCEHHYYTDDEFETNCQKIDMCIYYICVKISSEKYNTIVFPKDGFGTGLAELDKRAPKTFEYLNIQVQRLKYLCENYNEFKIKFKL